MYVARGKGTTWRWDVCDASGGLGGDMGVWAAVRTDSDRDASVEVGGRTIYGRSVQ